MDFGQEELQRDFEGRLQGRHPFQQQGQDEGQVHLQSRQGWKGCQVQAHHR